MASPPFARDPNAPYLEHYPESGGEVHRIHLEPLPFRIGRHKLAHYAIYSPQVSKEHAEIDCLDSGWVVRDLGSTNGTFVNGHRIRESRLVSGDILHIAHKEFRFACDLPDGTVPTGTGATESSHAPVPASLIRGVEYLRELLAGQLVRIVFQPIVSLDAEQVLGYEALGRGDHRELSASPGELFRLADQCRLSADLSRVFRLVAAAKARQLPLGTRVFFNLHPAELGDPALLQTLCNTSATLRPDQRMVVEIHEEAAGDVTSIRRLRQDLALAGIELAFDDFGAGQSRLVELAETPPDFIKLDMALIRGIDQAAARQEMVQALSRMITDFGVQLIAEGIETTEEARVCRGLGCQYGQGYLFGQPQRLTVPLFAEG